MNNLISGLIFTAIVFTFQIIKADPKAQSQIPFSEANRQDKEFMLTGQLFGYGPAASVMQGLNLGFFIDANSLIVLEITAGDNPLIWGSGGYTIKSFALGTHYKLFLGPTFYIKGGLDYKRIDYRYEDYLFGSAAEKTEFTGSSLGVGLSFGNQWQWSAFTFGFDWIGMAMPFTTQIDSRSTTGQVPDPKRLERDEYRYLKENVLIITRGYVGASF